MKSRYGQDSSPNDRSFFSAFFGFFLVTFVDFSDGGSSSRPSPTAFRLWDFALDPIEPNDRFCACFSALSFFGLSEEGVALTAVSLPSSSDRGGKPFAVMSRFLFKLYF